MLYETLRPYLHHNSITVMYLCQLKLEQTFHHWCFINNWYRTGIDRKTQKHKSSSGSEIEFSWFCRQLLTQIQEQNYQINVMNMFKVKNNNTRTMTSLWRFLLLTTHLVNLSYLYGHRLFRKQILVQSSTKYTRLMCLMWSFTLFGIYLLKVNNRDTRIASHWRL